MSDRKPSPLDLFEQSELGAEVFSDNPFSDLIVEEEEFETYKIKVLNEGIKIEPLGKEEEDDG